MDVVSSLHCKKSWNMACWRLQSRAKVRKKGRCQFCLSGSHGSSLSGERGHLFTLHLANGCVSVQLSRLCGPPPDISRGMCFLCHAEGVWTTGCLYVISGSGVAWKWWELSTWIQQGLFLPLMANSFPQPSVTLKHTINARGCYSTFSCSDTNTHSNECNNN